MPPNSTIVLFGLCCAIATGHLGMGMLGFTLGRQRRELNLLFSALTACAAWTVFWLGVSHTWPVEAILPVRWATMLLSGYQGPLLVLFSWGLVHPGRAIPRRAYGLLAFGLFGSAMATIGFFDTELVAHIMAALEGGEPDLHPLITVLYAAHSLLSIGATAAAMGILLHAIRHSEIPEVRGQASWVLLAVLATLAGFWFGNVVAVALGTPTRFASALVSLPALALVYRTLLSSAALMRRLELQRDNMARFVPAAVSELEQAVTLGGEEATVAVLFTDLRGFTALSEDLEPAELIGMLNRYLARMTDIVHAHGGIVDKYIGDAVLAVFGIRDSSRDPRVAAFHTAEAMHAALDELNASGSTPDLRMGAGIHYGPVVHGNVGSEARMEYTVLGDTVNLASRLESMSKELGARIVVSEAVASALGDEVEDLGEHSVRGRRQRTHLYGVRLG